jgi:hypothetical protein
LFTKHKTEFEISKVKELKRYFIMKHGCFTIFFKTALNIKMKKLWLSPRLKSLLPHVVSGDKVGQCWSKSTKKGCHVDVLFL